MSGSAIPYHLRPHKAVDRRLFVDLLTRLERWRPLHNYAYVSMGAYPLEDHKIVHRILGIKRLLAFDYDEEVVNRQKFNRPIARCKCIQAASKEVVDNFDHILKENKIDDAAGVIVWLDYTDPNEIQHQIREFQDLIDKLRPGDIVRVTVNAHFSEYADPVPKGQPQPKKTEKQQKTFQKLQSRIGEYLPSDASATDMTPSGLALLLSRSFGNAVHKAFQPTSTTTFKPLSVTRYADGLQMLTMTGAVVKRTEEQALASALDLKQWPFASNDWSTIHHLVVPALTLRERLFLEREIGGRPDRIVKKLGFSSTADVSIKDFLKSYRDYYRFYPTLLSADV
ncbi:O-methyltransferase [Agrobacterium cavarae]|uniref:O-methyltransferase n=1 Tax=Agrobacterium cavarae TaxID=2528239 RepID=UPI002899E336|nr:O-methyltransferase [Agrobacterium cavarae]